ncbi:MULTISPECIES: hypothetical protein [Paenarthrobacter]|jgi:hypothetical protein|uniref:hypothetical protein n=1 Tax=Paenarthrobacter TaxID=1742992 RepID=UPI001877A8A6|nr:MULTISPECIES: hypothetical protein [Paenarthrobacter]MCW3767465.1 hypothetical protein [Paenarthrobacter sp. PAE-2]QOT15419.1 hypothetical protein HMI59_01685 [Paenarthrobacter sp. YJN-5]QQQ62108.1 hypothetical protein JHQ56_18005 [Paenarthrobacter ureafaciens]UOD81080.1 hypothetical protein MQZ73_18555 [Paenarthrobacter ureafaciens]WNZ03739.1 hypothetical protein PVT25_19210 [Paenarthrobacter ureafaciens]
MANGTTPHSDPEDMEGQYSEGNYGDAGASPEALKEDAGGDYTAGDYAEKTVPSADAELDERNTEDTPEDRPFSSEPGDEAAGTGHP